MLVLSRKPGEKICIGPDIEVEFLGLVDGKARLGVSAPSDVDVHRQEVLLRIQGGELARRVCVPCTCGSGPCPAPAA
jgi:carbon storage regulator